MNKPPFDPTKPFKVLDKPPFNPNAPYEIGGGPTGPTGPTTPTPTAPNGAAGPAGPVPATDPVKEKLLSEKEVNDIKRWVATVPAQLKKDPAPDPEMMFREKYNTKLTPQEQVDFEAWLQDQSKQKGRDVSMDMGSYDLQGYWKNDRTEDGDGHMTDRYKKPNHPTFSDQSMYSGVDGYEGGKWDDAGGFTPSETTAKLYDKEYYDNLFSSEPDRPEYLASYPKDDRSIEQVIFDNRVKNATNIVGYKAPPDPDTPEGQLEVQQAERDRVANIQQVERERLEKERFNESLKNAEQSLAMSPSDMLFASEDAREKQVTWMKNSAKVHDEEAARVAMQNNDRRILDQRASEWQAQRYDALIDHLEKSGRSSDPDSVSTAYLDKAKTVAVSMLTEPQQQAYTKQREADKLRYEIKGLKAQIGDEGKPEELTSSVYASESKSPTNLALYRYYSEPQWERVEKDGKVIREEGPLRYYRVPLAKAKTSEGSLEKGFDADKVEGEIRQKEHKLTQLEAEISQLVSSRKKMFDPESGQLMDVPEENKVTEPMRQYREDVDAKASEIEQTPREEWGQKFIEAFNRFGYLDSQYSKEERADYVLLRKGVLESDRSENSIKIQRAKRKHDLYVNAKKELDAYSRVYLLNEDPSGVPRNPAKLAVSAAYQELLPNPIVQNTDDFVKSNENFIRTVQTLSDGREINLSNEQKKRFERTFWEDVGEGIGGIAGITPKLIVAGYFIGEMAAMTGLEVWAAKLAASKSRLDRLTALSVGVGLEEAKTLSAGLPLGMGAGFKVAPMLLPEIKLANIPKALRVPKEGMAAIEPKASKYLTYMQPFVDKMYHASVGGTAGMEAGTPMSIVATKVWNDGIDGLMNDDDWKKELDAAFPDISTVGRRVLTELVMNAMLGVPHLRPKDFLIDPKKIRKTAYEMKQKGYRTEAEQLMDRADIIEKANEKLQKGTDRKASEPKPKEPIDKRSVKNREELSSALEDVFGLSKKEAELNAAIYDAVASQWSKNNDRPKEDWYKRIEDIRKSNVAEIVGKVLYQVAVDHGTPNAPFDRFDIEKIGTGEGFLAFGHGHYFTDSPKGKSAVSKVAEAYAKMDVLPILKENVFGKEVPLEATNETEKELFSEIREAIHASVRVLQINKGETGLSVLEMFDNALEKLKSDRSEIPEEPTEIADILVAGEIKTFETEIELARQGVLEYEEINGIEMTSDIPISAVYKVILHEGKDPSEYNYASWYEPIDAVSRKAFEELVKKNGLEGTWLDDVLKGDPTFEKAYMAAVSSIHDPKKQGEPLVMATSELDPENREQQKIYGDVSKLVSQYLNRKGVDGIKYPANSLTTGDRTLRKGEINHVVFNDDAITIKDMILLQEGMKNEDAKAALTRLANGNFILHALTRPDVSSPIHELAHIFRTDLTAEQAQMALDGMGRKEWDTNAEEAFARSFEKYLYDGKAPNKELQSTFDRFRDWLLEIYRAITGSPIDIELTPKMVEVFDQVLGKENNVKGERVSEAKDATLLQEKAPTPVQVAKDLARAKEHMKEYLRALRGENASIDQLVADRLSELQHELQHLDVSALEQHLREAVASGEKKSVVDALEAIDPKTYGKKVADLKTDLQNHVKEWRKEHPQDKGASKEDQIQQERLAILEKYDEAVKDDETGILKQVSLNDFMEQLTNANTRKAVDKAISDINPTVSMRETTNVKEQARNFAAGLREGKKNLQAEKEALLNRMKDVIGTGNISNTRIQPVLTAIRDAKTRKAVDKAVERIERLQEEIQQQQHEAVKKEITDMSEPSKLTGKRSSGEKTGKLTDDERNVAERVNDLMKNGNPEVAKNRYRDIREKIDEDPSQGEELANEMKALEIFLMAQHPETAPYAKETLKGVIGEGKYKLKQILKEKADRYTENQNTAIGVILPKGVLSSQQRLLKRARSNRFWQLAKEFENWIDGTDGLRMLMDQIDQSWRDGKQWGVLDEMIYDRVFRSANMEKRRSLATSRELKQKAKEIWGDDASNLVTKTISAYRQQNRMRERYNRKTIKKYDPRLMGSVFETFSKDVAYGIRENPDGKPIIEPIVIEQVIDGKPVRDVLKLTEDEAAYAYALSKRADNHETFEKMGYTPEVLEHIINSLSPETREWVDWAMNELLPRYQKESSEVYERVNYMKLPNLKDYITIRRDVTPEKEQTVNEYLSDSKSVGHTSFLERTGSTEPFDLSMGFDGVLLNYLEKMDHYISYAENLKEVNAVLGNKKVRSAIEQGTEPYMLKLIDDQLSRVAHGGYQDGGPMQILNKLRSAHTVSALALAPQITLKQLTSFPAYFADIGVHNFLKEMVLGIANLPQTIKEIRGIFKDSAFIADRYEKGFDRDIKDLMKSSKLQSLTSSMNLKDFIMLNVSFGDAGAILAGHTVYKHRYRQALKEGMSKEAAREAAIFAFEKATALSQQASDQHELGYWQSQNPMVKLFTMYKTSPIAYFRNEKKALRDLFGSFDWQNKRVDGKRIADAAQRFIVYHFLLPMSFQYMGRMMPGILSDLDDEDKDAMWRSAIAGSLNGIFMLGDVLEFASDVAGKKDYAREFGNNMSPFADNMFRFTYHVMTLLNKYSEDDGAMTEAVVDEMWKTSKSGLDMIGLPASRTERTYEGWKAAGNEELGYSTKEKIALYAGWSKKQVDEERGGSLREAKEMNKETHKETSDTTEQVKDAFSSYDGLKEDEFLPKSISSELTSHMKEVMGESYDKIDVSSRYSDFRKKHNINVLKKMYGREEGEKYEAILIANGKENKAKLYYKYFESEMGYDKASDVRILFNKQFDINFLSSEGGNDSYAAILRRIREEAKASN